MREFISSTRISFHFYMLLIPASPGTLRVHVRLLLSTLFRPKSFREVTFLLLVVSGGRSIESSSIIGADRRGGSGMRRQNRANEQHSLTKSGNKSSPPSSCYLPG
jgi:hypothetical protein